MGLPEARLIVTQQHQFQWKKLVDRAVKNLASHHVPVVAGRGVRGAARTSLAFFFLIFSSPLLHSQLSKLEGS